MISIPFLQSERTIAPPFAVGDVVRILPYDGFPPRRHAGETGTVKRVIPWYDFAEHEHGRDYWVEIGANAWLYSESALEVAV